MITEIEVMAIVEYEYQVKLFNGDIHFITVYDLPERLAKKFVESKYPGCEIELMSEGFEVTAIKI